MKSVQRIISFLLASVMVIGMVPPVLVSAEEMEPTQVVSEALEETTAPKELVTEPTVVTTVFQEVGTESTGVLIEPIEEAGNHEESMTISGTIEMKVKNDSEIAYQYFEAMYAKNPLIISDEKQSRSEIGRAHV